MTRFEKEILNPFKQMAGTFGTRNAFCINEKYFSYTELVRIVSKIRCTLEPENIIGKNIGLIANNDIETYASILAIWLEGGAYVPIYPKQATEVVQEILLHTDANLVLDSEGLLVLNSVKTIDSRKSKFRYEHIVPKAVSDDSLAYIMFTSGSTGIPKGVTISRGNLASYVAAFWDPGYLVDENDRFLQLSDLAFDGSVMCFTIPLIRGACVYTVENVFNRYALIADMLEKYRLTVAFMVPSVIRYFKPYFHEMHLPFFRYLQIGGEAMHLDLLKEWSYCLPNAIIDVVYGTTENTIICSYYRFQRNGNNKTYNGVLSIGKHMSSGEMLIFDENNGIVSDYIHGELCLSGSQLSPGYWKNPDYNRESFFVVQNNQRFYRTGDICFRDSEGDFMFCGRKDSQIKIQGIRIELDEIAHHAKVFLKNQNAVAVSIENGTGNNEILLFIEGKLKDQQSLTGYLRSKMPLYMIPGRIIEFPEFPLNVNGKIDRQELKRFLKEDIPDLRK